MVAEFKSKKFKFRVNENDSITEIKKMNVKIFHFFCIIFCLMNSDKIINGGYWGLEINWMLERCIGIR